MPAAAVTPAPIAYANVVAVKKLVVGFLRVPAGIGLLVSHPGSGSSYFASALGWNSFSDRALDACLL